MTSPSPEPPRRSASSRPQVVHRFLGRLHEVLDGVGTETLWALTPAELGQCLEEAFAAQARLAAVTLALVAQADRSDLATHAGNVGLVAWLREHVRLAPAEGKRQIALARGLEQHRLTREALAAGAFPTASAAVVTQALDALPDEIDSDLSRRAEEHLAGEAHAHDTQTLRRLAAHLEEVLDPDGADARLAEQLARAEAKAARECFLQLRHDEATATTDGVFRLPLLQGVMLQRMLEAMLNPGRPDPIDLHDPETGVPLSGDERRGRALVELIERIPVKRLPRTGGCAPTVVVTMTLDALTGALQAARLDTGHAISPGLARRLAARYGLIPAVLGTSSQVLDLGRKARILDGKQRLALNVQQGGTCAVLGCQRPAAWCDGHHLVRWSKGGRTDLADCALICPRHHTLVHHPDFWVERLRPGRIQLHRRC